MRMALYDLAPQLTVASAIPPDGMCGCYSEETQTILIDRRLTYTAKRCTLVHELVHWKHGDDSCSQKWEARARMEAARLLISPAEYALAERAYDADPWLMADVLDVTVHVLNDYRSLLRDSVAASAGREALRQMSAE